MIADNRSPLDLPGGGGLEAIAVAPTVVTPASGPAHPTEKVLDRLLQMADGYRARQAVRQAEEMYFTLIEQHPDSPQSQQARERLMEMCDRYERLGQLHRARGIYERLL